MKTLYAMIGLIAIVSLSASSAFAEKWHYEIVDSDKDVFESEAISEGVFYQPKTQSKDIYYLYYAYWTGSDWVIQEVDPGVYIGEWTSIYLDSQDHPCIAYFDMNYYLKYAHWNGSEWEIEIVDNIGSCERGCLVLDGNDFPHIAYDDNEIMYAKWLGSEWEIQNVGFDETASGTIGIELDSNEYPHISYTNPWPNYDLKYAHWLGSAWSIRIVDTDGYILTNTPISLDSLDLPHFSYNSLHAKDYSKLKHTYWMGHSWEIEIVDSEDVGGWYSSIEIDSQDHIHISYFAGNDLKYAYYSGSSWFVQRVDSDGVVGLYTSIEVDSNDYPHISYFGATDIGLKYACWEGSYWKIQNVYTGGWGGIYTSIDLDSQDHPHISYIRLSEPGTDTILISFYSESESDAIALRWQVQTNEDEEILGFNLYRQELPAEASSLGDVAHNGIKDDWIKINPDLITGENPYSFTDSDVESGVAYEYKLEAVLADDSPETLGTTQATAGLPPTSFSILALYPNPASDYLTCLLALPSAGVVELTLYDLSGRLVLKQRLEATEPTELEAILDVSGLASGVYTLQASFGGAEVSARAVVVR